MKEWLNRLKTSTSAPTSQFMTGIDAAGGATYAQQTWSFRNRLTNANFDIWQRGTSFVIPSNGSSFTADRWLVWNGLGVSATVARVNAPAGMRGRYALNIQATGVNPSGLIVASQAFEAAMVSDLDGKPCVLSFDINGAVSAGSLSGMIYVHANTTPDDGMFANLIAAKALTIPVGSGTAVVGLSAADTIGFKNGAIIKIAIYQNGAVGNPNITISAEQFEADRQIAGAWGNPTPFEFRPLSVELAMCQRYAQIIGSGAVGKVTTASTWEGSAQFKTPMRATPTLTLLTTTISAAETGVSARVSSGSTLSVYSVTATGANDLGLSGWSGLTAPNLMTIGTDCILASAEL